MLMHPNNKSIHPEAAESDPSSPSASAKPSRLLVMNRLRTALSAEAAAVRDIQTKPFGDIRKMLAGPYSKLSQEAFYSGVEDLTHAASELIDAVETVTFPADFRPDLRGALPLSGVTIAVSQDIDVEGFSSRSLSPNAYIAASSSPLIARLVFNGAGLAASARPGSFQGALTPDKPWAQISTDLAPVNPFWPKASPGGAAACTAAAVAVGAASAGVVCARASDAAKSAIANGIDLFVPTKSLEGEPCAEDLQTLAPAQGYGFFARTAEDCARLAAAGANPDSHADEDEEGEACAAKEQTADDSSPRTVWMRSLSAAIEETLPGSLFPKRIRIVVGRLPEGWLSSPAAAPQIHLALEAIRHALISYGAEAEVAAVSDADADAPLEPLRFLSAAGLYAYMTPWLGLLGLPVRLSAEDIDESLSQMSRSEPANVEWAAAAARLRACGMWEPYAAAWMPRAAEAAAEEGAKLLEQMLGDADAAVILGTLPGLDAAAAPQFALPIAPAADPEDRQSGAFFGCTVVARPAGDAQALLCARALEAARAGIADAFYAGSPRPSFAAAPFVPGLDPDQAAHADSIESAREARHAEKAAASGEIEAKLAKTLQAAFLGSGMAVADDASAIAESFQPAGDVPSAEAAAAAEKAAAEVRSTIQGWCARHPISTPLADDEIQELLTRCLVWINSGRLAKVIAAISALPEEFRSFALIKMLANAYMNEGRTDDALTALETVRCREAGNAEWWSMRAMALDRAGSLAEAAKCVREALRLDPKSKPSLFLIVKTGAGAEFSESECAEANRVLRDVAPFEWQMAVSEARAKARRIRFEQELLPKRQLGRFSATLLLLDKTLPPKSTIIDEAKSRWGIVIEDRSPEDPDLLRFRIGAIDCSIRFWHERSTDPELIDMGRRSAQKGPMFYAILQHQSRISISLDAGAAPLQEAALIYSQLLEALIAAAPPAAVATLGVLLDPDFLTHSVTPPDYAMLPFWSTVHLGCAEELGEKFLFTYGLGALGRPELEMNFTDDNQLFATAVFYALAAQIVMQDVELTESSIVHSPLPDGASFHLELALGRASEGEALRLVSNEEDPAPSSCIA